MRALTFCREIIAAFPGLITFTVLLLVFTGVLDSISVLTLTPVIDLLINADPANTSSITKKVVEILGRAGIAPSLVALLLIFVAANGMRSLLIIGSRYFILVTKYALLRRIILGTFEDFFRARWAFFTTSKQGTLLNTFLRETTVVGDAFGQMASFFAQSIQCALFLAIAFYVSWKISLIAVSFAILLALPFTLFGRVAYRLGKMNTATGNLIGSVIQESLSSAKVILGFGSQHASLQSLAAAYDAHRNVTVKSQTLEAAVPQLYYPLGILVLAVTIFSSRGLSVPVSETAAVLYSFLRIVMMLGNIVAQKNSLNNFFPSYEQVMNLRGYARGLEQKSGSRPFAGLKSEIALDGVSFSYEEDKPVLRGVDLKVEKGRMTAIVGESGSGKSTLIDVVMGFCEPSAGRVTIDGVPLTEYDINSYRHRIGYVPQDSILFNMSIYDNLRWAKETATDKEIREACRVANAAEFIEQFPEGYDTVVGDRGVRLSGGQIQRVALARAILRRPDLLILDEATSSLDTRSERLIQEAIEAIAKETTIIVIAHRLSTIVNADYVYVIKEGRIIEEGTYAALMERKGPFSVMMDSQHTMAG